MTRLEQKEQALERLYQYRVAASKSNDVVWLAKVNARIDALEKEIIAIRKNK